MDIQSPLDDVLRNRTHLRLLRAIVRLPEGLPASARELGRRAGVSHPAASAALQELAEISLVSVQRSPRADLYRANPQHVVMIALGSLFAWESGYRESLLEAIQACIKEAAPWVKRASLFGSAAREDMHPQDVDVALFVPAREHARTEEAALEIAESIRHRFGVHLDLVVGDDRASGSRSRTRLWKHIERDGIPLLRAQR